MRSLLTASEAMRDRREVWGSLTTRFLPTSQSARDDDQYDQADRPCAVELGDSAAPGRSLRCDWLAHSRFSLSVGEVDTFLLDDQRHVTDVGVDRAHVLADETEEEELHR